MNRSGFEGYLSLKKEYSYTKKLGIDLNQVLSLQLLQIAYGDNVLNQETIALSIKRLFKSLDIHLLKEAFLNHQIVTSYIIERKDYSELTDSYFSDCRNYKTIFLPSLGSIRKFSLLNIIKGFTFIFFKKHSGTVKEKLYLASYLVYYMNILDTLNQTFRELDLSKKKYIPFNSSFNLESLFVLYFRTKNVSTYHISHGLSYVGYKRDTPADAINGDNITAEHILVWGESSKTDLVNNFGRNAVNITVAGNPKYAFKAIAAKRIFKRGIIFLGRFIYDDDNIELIKLAGKLAETHNIQFDIKAHPASNLEIFGQLADANNMALLNKEKTINQTLQSGEYDFAIAYNTTVYYEAMYHNMVCFRYGVNENEDFDGLDDKFYDGASFNSQLARFKQLDDAALNNDIEKVLVNNLGLGINKYRNILCN